MISSNLPEKLIVNGKNILDEKEIANEFDNFFVKIGPKLAEKIQPSKYSFESYIASINTKLPEQTVTINELKEASFSFKSNKSPGIDEISAKVIKGCFSELAAQLKHIFDLSLSPGIFPDKLKIAKVTPIYKKDEKTDLGNYRPFSILPCFSKILERLMYNRFFKCLRKYNILYDKQFGFRNSHSTEYTIIELIDKLLFHF